MSFPTPSPSPTQPPSGNMNNFPSSVFSSSASLYLYTFLATLVLLLTISGGIVFRSYLIRRRSRFQDELDTRNGVRRRRGFDPNAKPELHDVYLAYDHEVGLKSEEQDIVDSDKFEDPLRSQSSSTPAAGRWWDLLMPVAAIVEESELIFPVAATQAPPSPPQRIWIPQWHRRHQTPQVSVSSSSHSPSASFSSSSSSESHTTVETEKAQVAFLIAMPSPSRHHNKLDRDSDVDFSIPHVEFGITRIDLESKEGGKWPADKEALASAR